MGSRSRFNLLLTCFTPRKQTMGKTHSFGNTECTYHGLVCVVLGAVRAELMGRLERQRTNISTSAEVSPRSRPT